MSHYTNYTNYTLGKMYELLNLTISETFMIPISELPRVLYHGIVLACIILGFWLLDSLKDPILAQTIGLEYQPMAKLFSVITTLLVVCIYDYMTSIVNKLTLFHLVSWTYGLIFLLLSAFLSDSEIGLPSNSRGPQRIIGWFCYFTIESYGSLMSALFWSFTNSVMDLEQAKGTYGLIVSLAQIGAIGGSTLATNTSRYGISQLFIVGSMTIFTVSLLMKSYCIIYSDHNTEVIMNTTSAHALIKEKTNRSFSLIDNIILFFSGFYDGLVLIIQYNYILKILAVSCLYEVIVTVLDYQFKIIAARNSAISSSGAIIIGINESKFALLLGHFGQFTNLLSFFISIFGYSALVHRIGIKKSLLIFPIILFFSIILIYLVPTLSVMFIVISTIKALIFSLHDPIKELLYNPTSDSIKFKAKAWIDVFGSRLAKAIGSFITNMGNGKLQYLRNITEIPCLLLGIFIIYIAWSVGMDFENLLHNHHIIGDEEFSLFYGNIKDMNLPIRNGLRPGDVGYDGYDLHLFDGVFEEDEEDDIKG